MSRKNIKEKNITVFLQGGLGNQLFQIFTTMSYALTHNYNYIFEYSEKLDIGDGRARYEEAGEHHEHLIDVETGEIIEFQNEELEEMKRQVALNMGYELVDHRLELFGKKIKK